MGMMLAEKYLLPVSLSHTHSPIPNHPGLHKELLVALSCTHNLAKLGVCCDKFGDFGFLTWNTHIDTTKPNPNSK